MRICAIRNGTRKSSNSANETSRYLRVTRCKRPLGATRAKAAAASRLSQVHTGAPDSWKLSAKASSATTPAARPYNRAVAVATTSSTKKSSRRQRPIQLLRASSTPNAASSLLPGGKCRVVAAVMLVRQPDTGISPPSSTRPSACTSTSRRRTSMPPPSSASPLAAFSPRVTGNALPPSLAASRT